MAKKKIIHFGNLGQFVDVYPSDLERLTKLKADMFIQTSWSANIRGSVTPFYKDDPNQITGYTIFLGRGADTITKEIGPNDAITIFTGKKFNVKDIKLPMHLRDKIPFALSMNRDRCVQNLDELNKLYQEQTLIHDEAVLNHISDSDRAYIPIRFDFGVFHMVTMADSYGQYHIENGFYCFDKFPTVEETLEVLDNVPSEHIDIRRVEWVKNAIKSMKHDTSTES